MCVHLYFFCDIFCVICVMYVYNPKYIHVVYVIPNLKFFYAGGLG